MRHRARSVPEIDASRLLARHFRMLFERVGLQWTADNQKEVESITGIIIDAAIEEILKPKKD